MIQAPTAHPYGRHLAAAVDAQGREYIIPCPDPTAARKLAAALRQCRLRKRWGDPGTFDRTPTDPRGVGVGIYADVHVGVREDCVVLVCDPHFSRVPEGVRELKGMVGDRPAGLLRRLFGRRSTGRAQ